MQRSISKCVMAACMLLIAAPALQAGDETAVETATGPTTIPVGDYAVRELESGRIIVDYDKAEEKLFQPVLEEKEMIEALAWSAPYPLGSFKNPVRADMPGGQRHYLSRLRCENGKAPEFHRAGNVGPGVYGTIVDRYIVDCGQAEPGQVEIFMDMYFNGFVEAEPVEGFSIR